MRSQARFAVGDTDSKEDLYAAIAISKNGSVYDDLARERGYQNANAFYKSNLFLHENQIESLIKRRQEEANEKAISELHGYQYEIIPLDTRNKAAASGKLKAVILHDTKNLGQAMQRVRHKVPNPQQQPAEVHPLEISCRHR